MPKVDLSCYPIHERYAGGHSIALNIGGGDPLPKRKVEIVRAKDVLPHLESYIEELKRLNRPLEVSVSFDERSGRRPPGMGAIEKTRPTVNLDLAPARA
jgi:hypothetical protein